MSPIDSKIQAEGLQSENTDKGAFAWLRRNFWGLLTLAVVSVICIFVVQIFKKPGQMSVIESQAMDMAAMVPPKGAVPVGIAIVDQQTIEGSVIYTGTVQAFTDEDVYARVAGIIEKMPVYPGDRVRKGQLLVQLDPSGNSEYSSKEQEAASAEDSAMHNSGIAKSEFEQAKYQFEAAQEAEQYSKKAIEEAEANLTYWKPELEREAALLKSQVISLDEYQKEASEMKTAEAKVEEAKAKNREAKKTLLATQAAFDAMVHHIGHQSSAARQAKAQLKTATIQESYTRIYAQEDGVVTKRLVSPGVTVSPGILILKVAHLKQVRVQAEVASDDAAKIRVGDKVYIKDSEDSKEQTEASVTSVFPAADPASRTFTVEALMDNSLSSANSQNEARTQFRFFPGQYVIMRILTGQEQGLSIPTRAVVRREGNTQVWQAIGGGSSASKAVEYTCIMHPEIITKMPGKCPKCGMTLVLKEGAGGKKQAKLTDIEIGLSNPDITQVTKGLKQGDEVLFAGFENLQPEDSVVGTEWGKSGATKLPLPGDIAGNRLDSSNNFIHEEMIGNLMIKISLSPAKSGSNSVLVSVKKHSGGNVPGAKVVIKTSMPGMNDMPGPELNGTTGGDGQVALKSDLSSGLWSLKLSISAAGEAPGNTAVDLEVP
jgi:multidrug efflux pump subunit AcrA (membrane-fusion protein)